MFTLKVLELNDENFAPFGKVIGIKGKAPVYATPDFDFYAGLGQVNFGESEFGAITMRKSEDPNTTGFERHHNTQEFLMAVDGDAIYVAAKADAFTKAELDPTDFAAFLLKQGESILVDADIWHKLRPTAGNDSTCMWLYKVNTAMGDSEMGIPEEKGCAVHVAL